MTNGGRRRKLDRVLHTLAPAPTPTPTSECGSIAFRERERVREGERRKKDSLPIRVVLLTWAVVLPITAPAADLDLTGRISPQAAVTTYPSSSVFSDVFGSSSVNTSFDARVVFGLDHGGFNLDIDYQLIGVWADRLELSRELPPELAVLYPHLPSDRARLFDLTHVFNDAGKTATLQRLDRLVVGITTDRVVVRAGRQAITWGNGLVFNAMDIFNPFDPAAVDKEYKTGDDMLYAQVLRSNGDDLQGVMVVRRNPISRDVEADQCSLAAKYHHTGPSWEVDALAARHYGDTLVGFGANLSVGGGVVRGDLVVADTDDGVIPSMVASWSQSWTWGGTNVSGLVETFYNGFGQTGGCDVPACLADNPELSKRLARGELFNLGRYELALSAVVEVTPLFLLTPNVFINLQDPSALLQLVFQNDLRENLMLWSAITVPIGADGTEYGGPATSLPGRFLSTGPGASLQLVWYW